MAKDAVDMEAYRLEAKKEVARNYTASLMSNSKWRALFEALDAIEDEVKGVAVKFVGCDALEYPPVFPGLYPPHAFVDLWPLNIYPLVEIEWIEFRRTVKFKRSNNVPDRLVTQDIDLIRATIEATGKLYPIEETELGFRVIGHVK